MKCQYCDAVLTHPRARVCKSRECQNQGKIARLKLRRELNPEKYGSRPRQSGKSREPIGDDAPTELHYLDDEPGITIDELLAIHRDPVIQRKVQTSRQIRQRKLLQRINEAGLYDVII